MSPELPEWDLTPRQQFGQLLKKLRDAARMLSRDVATASGISADLASRLELGERWPKPEVVRAWAEAVGRADVADELVESLGDLRGLESRLRSEAQRPKIAQDLRSDLFKRAVRIRTFATTEIPFYLQTVEYARQDIGDAAGAPDVIAQRRQNGESVGGSSKNFEIILVESALRLFPCDTRTMRNQLSALQSLIDAPGVELGIIPLGTQTTLPLRSAFTVFDNVTVVESFAGAIDLTPKSAHRYIELMDRLWDEALRGEPVRDILTAAANALPAS